MNSFKGFFRLVLISASVCLLASCSDSRSAVESGNLSSRFDGMVQTGLAKESAASIGIMASAATELYLEYGVIPGQYTSTTSVYPLGADELNVFEVAGLEGDSQYFYRVRFRTDESDEFAAGVEYSFTTLDTDYSIPSVAAHFNSESGMHPSSNKSCSDRCQRNAANYNCHSVTAHHHPAALAEFADIRGDCQEQSNRFVHNSKSHRRG